MQADDQTLGLGTTIVQAAKSRTDIFDEFGLRRTSRRSGGKKTKAKKRLPVGVPRVSLLALFSTGIQVCLVTSSESEVIGFCFAYFALLNDTIGTSATDVGRWQMEYN